MATELERFCAAMDGEWVVDGYELEGDVLRINYRSQAFPFITWSHRPSTPFSRLPKVGTVGRIGFISAEALRVMEEPAP